MRKITKGDIVIDNLGNEFMVRFVTTLFNKEFAYVQPISCSNLLVGKATIAVLESLELLTNED